MVVPESINNIMSGLESTGGVTLHNHRRKLKQRFETIAKLGQGTYGKVQLGVNKETGQEVAIKTIKKCKIETEADLIRIRREIQIMSSLRHPYIIHIYEVFENRDKMVLVMEYAAGGELYDYLSKQKVLEESEARRIFRQIAMAVFYCHKHQICHRDLKLENILLDEKGNAKIADFGLSNVFDGGRLLSTFCGSPLYASPEIVKGIPYHGPEVDCWSLGVLLYTLVYGAMPFDGSNFKRLVRQISAGEYFEPKVPSSASDLIRGLLTVGGTERMDINKVCQHSWMNEEGKASCYRLALELAQEEPNRLDLLLALAPPPEQRIPVPDEAAEGACSSAAPVRSQSLSSLGSVQTSATFTTVPSAQSSTVREMPEEGFTRKRERSTSRVRKTDVEGEKPRRRSTKSKKKSNSQRPPRDEVEELLEQACRVTEDLTANSSPSSCKETVSNDLPLDESSAVPPMVALHPTATKGEDILSSSTNKETSDSSSGPTLTSVSAPSPSLSKELRAESSAELTKAADESPIPPSPCQQPVQQPATEPVEVSPPSPVVEEKIVDPVPFSRDSVRRKSKVFETAELYAKMSPTQEKAPPRKIVIPGVKVSDARAAFERRLSASSSSPPSDRKDEVSMASTVNVNKLVLSELHKDNDRTERGPNEEKAKKEIALKVISHVISESEMNEKKASTLPRTKLPRPSMAAQSPEPEVASHYQTFATKPKLSTVVTPSPPPRPSLKTADKGPREHIIPIHVEQREETPPQVVSRQASASSRASSSSLSRQDSDCSTTVSTTTVKEPIRKSPREVIIPIAVEGGGYVTPSQSTLSKMRSVSENEEDLPLRGFGLHSTRRRLPQLETTDSLSSDEDDGDFEAISTENLFSTLLARMRNLTQRLDEGRPAFSRLLSPTMDPKRLMDRSLDSEPIPWRRQTSTSASATTLPRGFTARPMRRYLPDDELHSKLPPNPVRRPAAWEDSIDSQEPQKPKFPRNPSVPETQILSKPKYLLDGLYRNPAGGKGRVARYMAGLELELPELRVRLDGPSRRSESVCMDWCTAGRRRPSSGHFVPTSALGKSLSRGDSTNERIKELHRYRRTVSEQFGRSMDSEGLVVDARPAIDNPARSLTIPDKYLHREVPKVSRFLSKVCGNDGDSSRVNWAIRSLRERSVGVEDEFSESKLLKRAVSMEAVHADGSAVRAAESTSGSPQQQRANDSKVADSTESTGDYDEAATALSQTDNSDTWSGSDVTERYFDAGSGLGLLGATEEDIGERIRMKSFYHRFNAPRRFPCHRSSSNVERKRYF